MLRRTIFRRADFFSTMVPNAVIQTPHVLTDTQLTAVKAALEEKKAVLEGIDLVTPFESLANIDNIQRRQKTIEQLNHAGDLLRSKLYKKDFSDPFHRLLVHELIMVLGFYERGLNSNELQGESVRFVLNHYGFDVRRDTTITKKIHESLLEEQTTTKQSEELLTYLLRLERHLSGKYRFAPVGGRRWFTLGLALSELSSEKEMQRVLDLPVVKQHGNFEVELDEKDPLWKNYVVKPKVENFVSFVESAKLTDTIRDADLIYNLRVQKPPRKLEYWEEMKEKLLQAWVIVFAVWISFWAVDEELITLFALIFLKHRQTKILEEEAEKTGGKVYIASSSGLTYR